MISTAMSQWRRMRLLTLPKRRRRQLLMRRPEQRAWRMRVLPTEWSRRKRKVRLTGLKRVRLTAKRKKKKTLLRLTPMMRL